MTVFRYALALLSLPVLAADPQAAERQRRFNELKFGMFIHWGPYSQRSVEASWPIMTPGDKPALSEAEYRALPETFNPTQFDPAAWIRLAKAAGQRYMVFTTKHHDGFCMFDTAYTAYKITNTPYQRDIVKMLADEAAKQEMPLGFYYSPPDLHHPAYRDTTKLSRTNFNGEPTRMEWPLYLDYMELQLRELLTRYGPVFVIWFDGLANQQKYDGYRFHKLIREIQPAALINNRIGLTGDFTTPEQRLPNGIPRKGARMAGVDANDQGVLREAPAPEEFQMWETCMTINGTWAYNRNDTRYKSVTEIIRKLIDAASKGGNFLLNVGPTPEGTIQPEFAERLTAVGQWLKRNGDAIYGSTYGPLQDLPSGRMTAKGRMLYLHIFDALPPMLEVAGLKQTVRRVTVLDGGAPVRFTQTGTALKVSLEGVKADPHATVLALESR